VECERNRRNVRGTLGMTRNVRGSDEDQDKFERNRSQEECERNSRDLKGTAECERNSRNVRGTEGR